MWWFFRRKSERLEEAQARLALAARLLTHEVERMAQNTVTLSQSITDLTAASNAAITLIQSQAATIASTPTDADVAAAAAQVEATAQQLQAAVAAATPAPPTEAAKGEEKGEEAPVVQG